MDGRFPPGAPRVGADAYFFLPSWRATPRDRVEAFLVGLPSPALLAPTMRRGVVALLLLHELSGDRRRWFEKIGGGWFRGRSCLAPPGERPPGTVAV